MNPTKPMMTPERQRAPRPAQQSPRDPRDDRRGGPPDLDELWRDFNRRLNGLFRRGRGLGGPRRPDLQPSARGTTTVLAVLALVLGLAWIGGGIYIVQDGQQAVVTRFGTIVDVVQPGLHWRLPSPIEQQQVVDMASLRSVDVGSGADVPGTGAPASAMLTADQDIIDVRMSVRYRVGDARAFLFAQRDPAALLHAMAAQALRAVIGGERLDQLLAMPQSQLAAAVRQRIAADLASAPCGIVLSDVTVQSLRAPEPVRAAFDDALKAAQQRDALLRSAQAYAADVVPRAQGDADRQVQQAQAYRDRVVTRAQGDAARFDLILQQYRKAPRVTRDGLYLQTMRHILSRARKVIVPQGSVVQLPAAPPAAKSVAQPAVPIPAASMPALPPDAAASAASSPGASDSVRDSLRRRAFR